MVREAVEVAVDKLGGAKKAITHLERVGVLNPENGAPYALSTVYAWTKGSYRPPVDVVFALAREASLDLNALVYHRRVAVYSPRREDVNARIEEALRAIQDWQEGHAKSED